MQEQSNSSACNLLRLPTIADGDPVEICFVSVYVG